MLGILLSNHGYKARQSHYEEKIEISVYALFDSFKIWLVKVKYALSKGSKFHDYKARQRNEDTRTKYGIHC